MKEKEKVARPGRLELPTLCLEGRRSIQLSYGRTARIDSKPFIEKKSTILGRLPSAEMADGLDIISSNADSRPLFWPARTHSWKSSTITPAKPLPPKSVSRDEHKTSDRKSTRL